MAHVFCWSGQEVPGIDVGSPCASVLGEDVRLIVRRIEGDCEQNPVTDKAVVKSLLQNAKVVRTAIAEFGRAQRV